MSQKPSSLAGVPLPEEELQATVRAVVEAGSKNAAAKALGIDRKTLSYRLARAAERGLIPPATETMPGYVVKSVAHLTVDGSWIKQVKEPGPEFEPPPGFQQGRITVLTDAEGRKNLQWQRWDRGAEDVAALIRTTIDELKQDLPRIVPTKGPAHSNSLLLNQYTVTDLHFGMLAWAEETGGADYDLKIAEKLLIDWFSSAIAMAPNAAVGVLAQLGDLMHHDALESVTPTHKHILDADSRLQKIIRVVIRVVRQIIAMMLAKYRRVHIVMASANHDPASSAWMRELLSVLYEDEPRLTVDDGPRVAVDNSPNVYYAYEWGNVALFYHHGHKRGIKDVDSVFAGRFREMFGRCKYSYAHIGHLHNDAVRETNLMKIERHRTLAPQDAYASSGGWLAGRDAKVITYHKEFGEVSRITISPQMLQAA